MSTAMLWSKDVERQSGGYDAKPPTARAQEIARSHEEMLGLLRDLPEAEYELSFTDLVERRPAVDGDSVLPVEKALPGEASASRGMDKVKEKRVRRSGSERWTGNGGGVLLNVYLPSSLTRSLTGSCLRQGTSKRVQDECNKRERQRVVFGCWSAIWERGGRGKPRRQ